MEVALVVIAILLAAFGVLTRERPHHIDTARQLGLQRVADVVIGEVDGLHLRLHGHDPSVLEVRGLPTDIEVMREAFPRFDDLSTGDTAFDDALTLRGDARSAFAVLDPILRTDLRALLTRPGDQLRAGILRFQVDGLDADAVRLRVSLARRLADAAAEPVAERLARRLNDESEAAVRVRIARMLGDDGTRRSIVLDPTTPAAVRASACWPDLVEQAEPLLVLDLYGPGGVDAANALARFGTVTSVPALRELSGVSARGRACAAAIEAIQARIDPGARGAVSFATHPVEAGQLTLAEGRGGAVSLVDEA